MPKRKTDTPTDAPTTAYLHVIDEEALSALVPLRRVGVWEGALPEGEIEPHLKPTLADGCAEVPGKASLAGYALLEGLLEPVPFEDGALLGGTQYLPIAAFHQPMYETVIEKLAATLSGYLRIIARNFANGKPGRPLASVAHTPVQVYGDMTWVAPGCIGTEYLVWEIALPTIDEAFEDEAEGEVDALRSDQDIQTEAATATSA